MLSAPTAEQPGDGVRFLSAAEIKRTEPTEPDWVMRGYLFRGGLTILAGKPKAGKSRLALDLTKAFAAEDDHFLGKRIVPGPVVYVSEEGAATLAHKLPDSERVRVLTRENAWPKPDWPTLVSLATAEAHRVGARLLVIDTLPYWAGMAAESEKDAGAALRVMSNCVEAARSGLAVLLPAHSRKGGGEDGEGIRGSSAFAGAVDVIVEMERVPDAPRQRVLQALSRFPQTPGSLHVELAADGETWRVIAEEADRVAPAELGAQQRKDADRQAILDALATAGASLTTEELEEETGSPRRQLHEPLKALVAGGLIVRQGAGKKGDPYRFEKVRMDSAQDVRRNDPATILVSAHPRRGAETESSLSGSVDAAQCAETGGRSRPLVDDDPARQLERLARDFNRGAEILAGLLDVEAAAVINEPSDGGLELSSLLAAFGAEAG